MYSMEAVHAESSMSPYGAKDHFALGRNKTLMGVTGLLRNLS